MKKELIAFYLDWVNSWLTVEKMAENYGLLDEECLYLIAIGKRLHEETL